MALLGFILVWAVIIALGVALAPVILPIVGLLLALALGFWLLIVAVQICGEVLNGVRHAGRRGIVTIVGLLCLAAVGVFLSDSSPTSVQRDTTRLAGADVAPSPVLGSADSARAATHTRRRARPFADLAASVSRPDSATPRVIAVVAEAISSEDSTRIQSVCELTREALGPGPYNRCIRDGVETLRKNPMPSFDEVPIADQQGIKASCELTRTSLGPGPYHRCLTEGIHSLAANSHPVFDGVPENDRRAIEATCKLTRDALGPGPYNRCLRERIEELRANATPSFAGIKAGDRTGIEATCRLTGEALGPGAYNKCLADGIRQLRENPGPPT